MDGVKEVMNYYFNCKGCGRKTSTTNKEIAELRICTKCRDKILMNLSKEGEIK